MKVIIMAKREIFSKDLAWLKTQEHVSNEDVESIVGKFDDRQKSYKKSLHVRDMVTNEFIVECKPYHNKHGMSSYMKSQHFNKKAKARDEQRKLEREELLDPVNMQKYLDSLER
jgi:hypothetical protein|tara:strand:- start:5177 stop:5518 length:342 start_codon:yes stop_codon:yes gene_type:complete